MSLHLDYVTKIKEQANRFNTNPDLLFQKEQEETERNLICSALIKCADISNVVSKI
jgi:protein-disulfide isomerase